MQKVIRVVDTVGGLHKEIQDGVYVDGTNDIAFKKDLFRVVSNEYGHTVREMEIILEYVENNIDPMTLDMVVEEVMGASYLVDKIKGEGDK